MNLLLLFLFLPLYSPASDLDEIKICLQNWKTHPFGKSPDYRVISGKVKVMGVGGEINDQAKTEKPELILVKPSVSVMSKSDMSLLNPNGWYCLKAKVDVLGKTVINIDCNAKLTSSNGSTTVLGSNDSETGVNVLAKSVINKIGCKKD